MENGLNSQEAEVVELPVITSPEIKGELDVQIVTAKKFPRSISAFKKQALDMATLDEETASGCFYSLPRGGKPIEGPSARLAEIVLSAWGNIRSDAKVVEIGERDITAESTTWDLEKNVAVRIQHKRRITDRSGKRYNDDMISVTGNAACSIALRNSVFKVIPMVYTRAIYHEARRVAIGDIKTLAAKRAEMISYFGKMGVTPDRIFRAVDKKSVEDIGLEELATLKGLATAIREGDTTIEEAFPVDTQSMMPKRASEKKPDPLDQRTEQEKAAALKKEESKPDIDFDSLKADVRKWMTQLSDADIHKRHDEFFKIIAPLPDEDVQQLVTEWTAEKKSRQKK